MDLLTRLVAIWIALMGFAFIFGIVIGTPEGNVARLNKFLFGTLRKAIGRTFLFLGRTISPSQPRRRRP